MSIFKAYDIRGIYGKNITSKEAYLIGYYLPKFLKIDNIKIGHDLRLSYKDLTKFLIQGLLDANCEITYLGKTSTPNFYFSLFKDVNSGIMITASHNDKEYNGFKFIYNLTSFDSRNGLYELEKLINRDEDKKTEEYNQIKASLEARELEEFLSLNEIRTQSTLKEYVKFLNEYYNLILNEEEKNIIKNLNFSLDFSSGVSSLALEPLKTQLGLKCTLLNEKPDGNFPVHSPDPSKVQEYLKNLENKSSTFTAVFDGDGDRILFYDKNNEIVFTDYIIAILIDYFHKNNPNSKHFVCDLRTSKYLSEIAKEKHIKIELIRVGRAFYQDYMNNNSCVYGAELTGHMFFRDFKNFDNPDIALIHILKIVAHNIKKNPTEKFDFLSLVNKYKKYHKIKETNLKVNDADKVLEELRNKNEKNIVLKIDGYSFEFENYWFNIRKSNTEPVVRINFEGKEEKTTIKEFENLIKNIQNI